VKGGASAPAPISSAPATLTGAARVVVWGLAFWGGEQLVAAAFVRSAMATELIQAALATWGAGPMGIAWSEPPGPAWPAVGRRVARGAAAGFGAAAWVAVVAMTGHATVVARGEAAASPLLVGLVAAALGAVRDELLLRGVVLGATRLLPVSVSLIACGLAAAAARFGTEGVLSSALAPEALRGVALGALWVRDRGAWMACAANTAWTWTMGSLLGGGLVDLRFAARTGGADSGAALAVLAVAAAAASFAALGAPRAIHSTG
jgi:hypothetical protein